MNRNLVVLLTVLLLFTACTAMIALPPISIPEPVVGDAERGAQIFAHGMNQSPPCSTCHLTASDATGFSLGPNLADVSERAGTRVEGLGAAAYIRQSILEPHHFVVPGYRDIMYPDYAKHFTDQDIADLLAYLLTLG